MGSWSQIPHSFFKHLDQLRPVHFTGGRRRDDLAEQIGFSFPHANPAKLAHRHQRNKDADPNRGNDRPSVFMFSDRERREAQQQQGAAEIASPSLLKVSSDLIVH